MTTATAQANANIAFIKYWGNFVISLQFKAKW
jgi:mevalonate pyrophosphate decarboxylase